MFSTAALKFFVSEQSKAAMELKDFVERKLTFKTPAGTLRLHPGYLQLKKLIAKAHAVKAEIPVKEVYFALSEKLEPCDGLSVALDRINHAMYVTRRPYRQGAIPKTGACSVTWWRRWVPSPTRRRCAGGSRRWV